MKDGNNFALHDSAGKFDGLLNGTRSTSNTGVNSGSQDLTSGCVISSGRCCRIEASSGTRRVELYNVEGNSEGLNGPTSARGGDSDPG